MRTVTQCCFLGVSLALACLSACDAAETVAERRGRVLKAAAQGTSGLAALQAGLRDDSPLVRRPAVRALSAMGAPARGALSEALSNPDAVVRRAALVALVATPGPEALPVLTKAIGDSEADVRETAVRLLSAIKPPTDAIVALLRQAASDPAPAVQMAAGQALSAAYAQQRPFHVEPPDRVLLHKRPDMVDHVTRIVVAQTVPLPATGWRLKLDPGLEGHVQKWYEAGHDDNQWGEAAIETFCVGGYTAVGWYRRGFDLPAREVHLAAELVCEAVDESAWVWVNGVYVGGQDIGTEGWDKPFRVDVTPELRWGASNQITVRVLNRAFAGGIWKPVRIETLKLK